MSKNSKIETNLSIPDFILDTVKIKIYLNLNPLQISIKQICFTFFFTFHVRWRGLVLIKSQNNRTELPFWTGHVLANSSLLLFTKATSTL